MKILGQYGSYKVVEQHRCKWSNQTPGMKPAWTEYQVRQGRKVIARHDLFSQAVDDAKARNTADWEEIGRQLGAR